MVKGYYCKGTVTNTEDILDFANMVFSMSYKSVDFAKFLPKAYSDERCNIPIHHIIKESEKIKALIDVYPVNIRQFKSENSVDCEIKAAYIGTVCVHPNSRGKGYMIELMQKAEQQAREAGCDMMLLDGSRHRYQNYGFERAGMKYNFNIEYDNLRHCCSRLYDEYEQSVYSFELVERDSIYLDEMYELYMRRNVIARSREDFYLCLKSNYSEVYAVLKDDAFAGYINISAGETNIHEIQLKNASEMPKIIYDLFDELGLDEIGITVGIDEVENIEWLNKMSDYYTIGMSHQIKILNYENVLKFLFKWKQRYCDISDGRYIIGVLINGSDKNNIQKNYCIEIVNKEVSVLETDIQISDIVFEERELVLLLTTSYCLHEQNKKDNRLLNSPKGWFPLPFFLPEADAF